MSVLFDDVSRILAGSSSRTHALKLIGGALGGAALTFLGVGCSSPGVGTTPQLEHSSVVSLRCRKRRRCGSHCCTKSQHCCNQNGTLTCCDGACCPQGQTCCGSTCCNSGQICCRGNFHSACCNSGQICCGTPAFGVCCKSGQTCCVVSCCNSGQKCSRGKCVA